MYQLLLTKSYALKEGVFQVKYGLKSRLALIVSHLPVGPTHPSLCPSKVHINTVLLQCDVTYYDVGGQF